MYINACWISILLINMQDNKSTILLKDNVDIVLYDNTLSGYCSAFIIWLYYKNTFGKEKADTINFIASNKINIFDNYLDKNILIIGLSLNLYIVESLLATTNSLLIVDNRKTVNEKLRSLDNKYKMINLNKSIVSIIWHFWFDTKMPNIMSYIKDYDTYKFLYSQTEIIISYINTIDRNFLVWEELVNRDIDDVIKSIDPDILKNQKHLVDKLATNIQIVVQEIDKKYIIVSYINSNILQWEISEHILNKNPYIDFISVYYYDNIKNITIHKLFSNKSYPVNYIALKNNGDGNRTTATCILDNNDSKLNYDIINADDLLTLFRNHKKEKTSINKTIESYVIINYEKFNPEWISEKFLELTKRYFSDCIFIWWETESKNVDYDIVTKNIIKLNKYLLFFNEMSIKKKENEILYRCVVKDLVNIEIETSKSIKEIFSYLN